MDKILARDCIPANAAWCTSPPGSPWLVHAWDAAVQHAGLFVLFVAVWAVVLLLIRAVWRRGPS